MHRVRDRPPLSSSIVFLLPSAFFRGHLSVTRTLYPTPTRAIYPPSPRLLAIHHAIAHILHLSAAGALSASIESCRTLRRQAYEQTDPL
ncbi:hypothetical protein F4824DRAFT_462853, partial [Ustulina deusta]